MKSLWLAFTVALFSLAACTPREEKLRSGDLIFVGIPFDKPAEGGSMGQAIASATGKGELNLIHVAIAEVQEDSVFVFDVTLSHPTRRSSLAAFVKEFTRRDGSLPEFLIYRPTVSTPAVLENAKAFCGEPYDTLFLPHNGALYCSELVWESYRTGKGERIFQEKPMNFKSADGTYPEYWTRLFGRMGVPIPQGVPGTNPQDMAASPCLEKMDIRLTDYL